MATDVIDLKSPPESTNECPNCERPLKGQGPVITGMRALLRSQCSGCGDVYYEDLPVGHGRLYPCLLDAETGKVFPREDGDWFARWIQASFKHRHSKRWEIDIDRRSNLDRPLILNCLDVLYGHSLLKLLNASYHLNQDGELDLVVFVPKNLEWMVPGGVAEVWSINAPYDPDCQWNDWFKEKVAGLIDAHSEVYLSGGKFLHGLNSIEIERYTSTKPFDPSAWEEGSPTITYIWRPDRIWGPKSARLLKAFWAHLPVRSCPAIVENGITELHERHLSRFFRHLGRMMPEADLRVAGVGSPDVPSGVENYCYPDPTDKEEHRLCSVYGTSNLVIGVHGSHMILPSAHAGSTLELLPSGRLGNITQDILSPVRSPRELLFRHRFVPLRTRPKVVAEWATGLIESYPRVAAPTGDSMASGRKGGVRTEGGEIGD